MVQHDPQDSTPAQTETTLATTSLIWYATSQLVQQLLHYSILPYTVHCSLYVRSMCRYTVCCRIQVKKSYLPTNTDTNVTGTRTHTSQPKRFYCNRLQKSGRREGDLRNSFLFLFPLHHEALQHFSMRWSSVSREW